MIDSYSARLVRHQLITDQDFFDQWCKKLSSSYIINEIGFYLSAHTISFSVRIDNDYVDELLDLLDGNGFEIQHYSKKNGGYAFIKPIYEEVKECGMKSTLTTTVTTIEGLYQSYNDYYNSEEIQMLRDEYNYYKVPKCLKYNKKYRLKPEPEHPP